MDLKIPNTTFVRMGIEYVNNNDNVNDGEDDERSSLTSNLDALSSNVSVCAASKPRYTYKLEEGVCTDSLAWLTAANVGVDESLIRRAGELTQSFCDNVSSANEFYPAPISLKGFIVLLISLLLLLLLLLLLYMWY